MANTHTLKIESMECIVDCDGLKDLIKSVHYRYEVSDGTNSTMLMSVETLDAPDPELFTPFDQLDEATVSGWILSKWGDERVAEMKANLDAQLDEMINPPIVTKHFEQPTIEQPIDEPTQ